MRHKLSERTDRSAAVFPRVDGSHTSKPTAEFGLYLLGYNREDDAASRLVGTAGYNRRRTRQSLRIGNGDNDL